MGREEGGDGSKEGVRDGGERWAMENDVKSIPEGGGGGQTGHSGSGAKWLENRDGGAEGRWRGRKGPKTKQPEASDKRAEGTGIGALLVAGGGGSRSRGVGSANDKHTMGVFKYRDATQAQRGDFQGYLHMSFRGRETMVCIKKTAIRHKLGE